MNKIHINKISEINRDKLIKFYNKSFNFEKSVLENFEWRYRFGFSSFEPIALIINNEIAGHAGLIPVKIKIDNEVETAIWFTDFYIAPEYRLKGFGETLTKEWMKICPTQITICNDKSLRIFKKYNWSNNHFFKRNIKICNYFKILPILRSTNQFEPLSVDSSIFKLEEKSNSTIEKIANIEQRIQETTSVGIIRDESWFKWRILECPYRKNILIFRYEKDYFLTRIQIKKKLKILKFIYSTKIIDNKTLILFSEFIKKNKIDIISYISKENSAFDFNLPWKKKINFAFFSNEKSKQYKINESLGNLQFIDSDIDFL